MFAPHVFDPHLSSPETKGLASPEIGAKFPSDSLLHFLHLPDPESMDTTRAELLSATTEAKRVAALEKLVEQLDSAPAVRLSSKNPGESPNMALITACLLTPVLPQQIFGMIYLRWQPNSSQKSVLPRLLQNQELLLWKREDGPGCSAWSRRRV